MKIASIDIGIDTFSFCILTRKEKKGSSSPEIKIRSWNIIPLFEENEKHCCEGINSSTGKNCNKYAKNIWKGGTEEESYFCGFHLKGKNPDEIEPVNHINTKTIGYPKLFTALDEVLESIDFSKCDKIFLENQKRGSLKMQAIAHAVYFYLVKTYLNDEEAQTKVVAYAPQNKYKCYFGPPIETKIKIPNNVHPKSKKGKSYAYRIRKEKSILMAREMLIRLYGKENNKWLEFFDDPKNFKKDDLSDCFLQGMTILMGKEKNND